MHSAQNLVKVMSNLRSDTATALVGPVYLPLTPVGAIQISCLTVGTHNFLV
jgi:hypothetical protein